MIFRLLIFNSCISCPKIVNLIENWGEKVDENWGDSLLLCDVITTAADVEGWHMPFGTSN